MKNKIAAIFLFCALFLIVIGGLYFYTEFGQKSEVCFYVDSGEGEEEYWSFEINWNNVSLSLPEDPTREGYIFDGWYFDNGTFKYKYNEDYFENNEFMRKVSLYAKWVKEPCYHTSTTVSITDPTCVTEGHKDTICRSCNAVIATETIPTIEHKYVGTLEFELVDGEKIFNCKVGCVSGCDHTKLFEDVDNVMKSLTREPACDLEGEYTYSYHVDGYGITVTCTEPIPEISHKIGERFYDDILSEYGYIPYDLPEIVLSAEDPLICGAPCDAYYECSVCYAFVNIEAFRPHNYDAELVANDDYTEFRLVGVCVNEECGAALDKVVSVDKRVIIPSTCISEGAAQYYYTYYGKEYTLDGILPFAEHSLEGEPVSAFRDYQDRLPITVRGVHFFDDIADYDCDVTRPGYYTCDYCGGSFSSDVYKPHNWSNWVTTAEPDCTTPGSKYRTCGYCGDVENRTISALGHSYDEYILQYNKNADGNAIFDLARPCRRCSYIHIIEEYVNVKRVVIREATCKEEGIIRYDYTNVRYPERNCSFSVSVPKTTYHSLGSSYIGSLIDDDGKFNVTDYPELAVYILNIDEVKGCMIDYEGFYVCSVCERSYSLTVYRGHDYRTWTNTLDPTCTTTGTAVSTCEYEGCGHVGEKTVPTAPHPYVYSILNDGETDSGRIDPHAVEIFGVCSVCGATDYVTGFDNVEVEFVVDPTCLETGKKVYKCEKEGTLYVAELILTDRVHGFVGGDIENYLNSDGSINSNIPGIYMIEDSESADGKTCRGGYICCYCNKFVELVVVIVP